MKLTADEPRMRDWPIVRQLDDLAQVGRGGPAGNDQSAHGQSVEKQAVDLIAVTMALDDLVLTIN